MRHSSGRALLVVWWSFPLQIDRTVDTIVIESPLWGCMPVHESEIFELLTRAFNLPHPNPKATFDGRRRPGAAFDPQGVSCVTTKSSC